MKNFTTLQITRAATIAALYAVLTLGLELLIPQSGAIQFRVAEALTILPLFFAEAIPGVAIGCLIVNIFSPGSAGVLDMVFGTLTSLAAAVVTWRLRKIQLGVIPPIVFNALIVPAILAGAGFIPPEGYLITVLWVFIGQAAVVLGLGIPLYFGIKKLQPKVPFLQNNIKKRVDEDIDPYKPA